MVINPLAMQSITQHTSADAAQQIMSLFDKVNKEVADQGDKITQKEREQALQKLALAQRMIEKGDFQAAKALLGSIERGLPLTAPTEQGDKGTQQANAQPDNTDIVARLTGKGKQINLSV